MTNSWFTPAQAQVLNCPRVVLEAQRWREAVMAALLWCTKTHLEKLVTSHGPRGYNDGNSNLCDGQQDDNR